LLAGWEVVAVALCHRALAWQPGGLPTSLFRPLHGGGQSEWRHDLGKNYWGWLYINLLFNREDLRGQGYGRQLLTLAEEEARQRGAIHAFFDTFSFQTSDYYKKHGYRVFGELTDFPQGHTRYYMTKTL
jgi:GNAT superfamily N-acetyltransferase